MFQVSIIKIHLEFLLYSVITHDQWYVILMRKLLDHSFGQWVICWQYVCTIIILFCSNIMICQVNMHGLYVLRLIYMIQFLLTCTIIAYDQL